MSKVLVIENSSLQYKAYIAVDSVNRQMAFGGCRFSPDVDESEVRELARCMTLKLALHGLPVGGAKGGIAISPSQTDWKAVLSDFSRQAKDLLRKTVVLGKDLGATDEKMDFIYQSIGIPQLSPVHLAHPDKTIPERLRSFTGYQHHMTGQGVAWALQAATNGSLRGKTALIQGAGAVGLGSAYRLLELGVNVLGISDKNSTIFSLNGFSFDELFELTVNGTLMVDRIKRRDVQVIPSNELLKNEADILVLAASSHSVNRTLAQDIKTPMLVEGANFGLTDDARSLLHDQGTTVVPDIIANSSSAAMVALQMASGNSLSHQEVWAKIYSSISKTTRYSIEIANAERITPRDAYMDIISQDLLKKTKQAA